MVRYIYTLSTFSKIGGNFGLLTGMTIWNMFELAFWLICFILESCVWGKMHAGHSRDEHPKEEIKGKFDKNHAWIMKLAFEIDVLFEM